MKFRIEFDMNNAAFEHRSVTEPARILKEAIRKMERGATGGACMDINGNKVGEWEIVR